MFDGDNTSFPLKVSAIAEAASPVLFHYTNIRPALDILSNNAFKLSISQGSVEAQYAPKGYNYFLSTSRSKAGGYHNVVGNSAVMFNLDGNWFNQHYPSKAIDYWAGFEKNKHSETEDRIFSRVPEIPADAITEIHILLQESDAFASPVTRQLLIQAKKRGLPTYLYKDKNAWRLQNTSKSVSISKSLDILRGQKSPGYVSNYPGDKYLNIWLELIFKKKRSELSKEADKFRYSLTFWSGGQFADDLGLRNELSNARKPGNAGYEAATKIIAAMRKLKVTDERQLISFLHKKWDAEAQQKESAGSIDEALLRTNTYGGWIEDNGHVGYVDFGTGQSEWDGHAGYLLNFDYSKDKDQEQVMEEGWVRFITAVAGMTQTDISLNGTLAGLRKQYRVYAQTVLTLPPGSRVFIDVLYGTSYTFMMPEQKRDFMKLFGPQAQAVAQPERELQTASKFTVSERTEGNFISPPGNTVGLNVFELSPAERQSLNGTVVYHQTKKLDKILQSGGLRPRADASGENSFAVNAMRAGRDWRTPKGIFVSQTKSNWFGDEIAFKIESTDQIYRAYNPEMGHLLIANPIPKSRFSSVNDKPLTEGPIWNKIKGAATAGAVAGTIGYAALSGQAAKSPEMEPPKATIQQVQPTKDAPIVPVAPKSQEMPTVTISQLEKSTSMDVDAARQKILWKTASSSGLKGVEAAQFLAQAAHETLGFNTLVEIGNKAYFKQYDIRFNPEKARLLGNIKPGDGERYKGRGFIQITGRDNYRKAGEALGIPLEKKPELASKPEVAAKIAVWFWKTRVRPNVDDWHDTRSVTRKINPAMQGLEDRHTNFYDYMKKLKVAAN